MLFSVPPYVSLRILRTWGFAEEEDYGTSVRTSVRTTFGFCLMGI